MGSVTLSEWTLLDAEPGVFSASAWHDVLIIVWLAAATETAVARLDRAVQGRLKSHPNPKSGVHIATGNARPPEPDARQALIEMNERLGEKIACGAVVIERGGLAGIALRSAVTGIIIVAPKHFRVKVFDTLDPCAPWVAEQHAKVTAQELDADALAEVLKHARAEAH